MKNLKRRHGFTMIELIFIIVILGILASVAIPKLMGTRDDANAVKEVADLKTAKIELMSHYLLGHDNTTAPTNSLDCFTISVSATNLLTVVSSGSTLPFCPKAVLDANESGLMINEQM